MERTTDLGEFLRTRRARRSPQEAGLPGQGGRRRVPGLRREELAQPAGISPGYYTRREQGAGVNASDAVLDALARVLRLADTERTHLYALARPDRTKGAPERPLTPERLRPSARAMIGALGEVPALVLGRFTGVLAWNGSAHALLAGHLPYEATELTDEDAAGRRPGIARRMFLDPDYRALFADPQAKGRDTVADLRRIAGRRPGAAELTGLIAELTRESAEFAAEWMAHPVRTCATHTRDYRHPLVGPPTLADELLTMPDDAGQRVAIFHAEPGSPSADALRRLSGALPPRR
ncbi:helix-turn-helix transcriptional regulator [Streptomyces sp. NPDC101393]|uniref:helix-turn-helix transcriptional regulator n=1 Tax=Streptomyces sp. NPDC101393 TaxID=3366141 RepID=UPI0038166DA0